MASPYIAIANGSPCVVPSLDRITFLFTKTLDGLEYEFRLVGSIERHMFAMFLKPGSGLGSLMHFPRLSVVLHRNLFSRIAS